MAQEEKQDKSKKVLEKKEDKPETAVKKKRAKPVVKEKKTRPQVKKETSGPVSKEESLKPVLKEDKPTTAAAKEKPKPAGPKEKPEPSAPEKKEPPKAATAPKKVEMELTSGNRNDEDLDEPSTMMYIFIIVAGIAFLLSIINIFTSAGIKSAVQKNSAVRMSEKLSSATAKIEDFDKKMISLDKKVETFDKKMSDAEKEVYAERTDLGMLELRDAFIGFQKAKRLIKDEALVKKLLKIEEDMKSVLVYPASMSMEVKEIETEKEPESPGSVITETGEREAGDDWEEPWELEDGPRPQSE